MNSNDSAPSHDRNRRRLSSDQAFLLLGEIQLKVRLEQVEGLLFQGDGLHGLDVPAVIAEELGALTYDARLIRISTSALALMSYCRSGGARCVSSW